MDAATLYMITTLASGQMKVHAIDLPATKCELTAVGLREHGTLAWCRQQRPVAPDDWLPLKVGQRLVSTFPVFSDTFCGHVREADMT